jgi:hypothetical protein
MAQPFIFIGLKMEQDLLTAILERSSNAHAFQETNHRSNRIVRHNHLATSPNWWFSETTTTCSQ